MAAGGLVGLQRDELGQLAVAYVDLALGKLGTMRVVNYNTGAMMASGMGGASVGLSLAPGTYYYAPEEYGNAYFCTVVILKR
ncbi:hypothetical protein [Cupriavidus alkaliphilus]|uniref:hypothetical protein n=1 Tax=Cupriavidus alkaliphilus TaxID=942866 RepID=UPI001612814D|nr:hypothetical protein [Cupriavidus alkaliphilus]MBB2918110.1 hypothetical protein [Cupriavidus alkaliphilus]